jgi:putative flippase GtrA
LNAAKGLVIFMKNKSRQFPLLREMFLYGVIGIISAASDSGLYYLLTRHVLLQVLVANFISVNVGITISFLLNTYINFKKTNKIGKRAISFYTVGYAGLLLSTLLLIVGVNYLKINDFAVKIVSIFIVAVFQYVLNKIITYGKIK